jgi:cytochrome c553
MISQAVFKMVLPMACAWAEEQKAVMLRVALHSRHRRSPMRACRDHTLRPARRGCAACHRHEAKGAKADIPYAIPIPGKQGFVTSRKDSLQSLQSSVRKG